jgi:hypothetical protein
MLETVPLLVIFAMLMGFSLGFYGIIQTAILHSIAARTYAFETFRNRANLYYYREDGSGLTRPLNFTNKGWRFHAVTNESDGRDFFVPSMRSIAMGWGLASEKASETTHDKEIFALLPRNDRVGVNPAWIMVGYGICLNAGCGN